VRRLSPYVTRLLIPTPLSPNAVTVVMLLVGLVAAAVLTLPGVLAAVVAAVLIQGQILLDCSDGELARWRRQFSAAGIYLDRFAHYVTETALPIALGVRADGGFDDLGGFTMLGLLAAVLSLIVRMETALVIVARAEAGLERAPDTAAVAAPRRSALATLRRWAGAMPFFRAFVAVEASLLALVAALVDMAVGDLTATCVLVVALVPIGVVTAVGHLVAILASSRLR
jgi:phosphatidylglycerophosphate synthase